MAPPLYTEHVQDRQDHLGLESVFVNVIPKTSNLGIQLDTLQKKNPFQTVILCI